MTSLKLNKSTAEHNQIEPHTGNFNINVRPFVIPDGVFDEKRLVSEKEYEEMFKSGKLRKNTINPKYLSQS